MIIRYWGSCAERAPWFHVTVVPDTFDFFHWKPYL